MAPSVADVCILYSVLGDGSNGREISPVKNSRSLEDLLPPVRAIATSFIALAELELSKRLQKRVKVRVTSTLRDNEYQAMLYAQGRTVAGKVVTNSKPGASLHNYGCALDVALEIDGQVVWSPKSLYKDLGEIGESVGLVWGGDWDGDNSEDANDWDLCHFQYTGGLTLAQVRSGETVA